MSRYPFWTTPAADPHGLIGQSGPSAVLADPLDRSAALRNVNLTLLRETRRAADPTILLVQP